MVTWDELVVEDPSQPVTRIEGPGGFGGFFSVGSTTTVIYAYQDSAGNIGRCTFDVTVTSKLNSVYQEDLYFCLKAFSKICSFTLTELLIDLDGQKMEM